MNKVIVIGAGAAGMVAAIVASSNSEVILLDSNDKCGKKLLLTGNGRCNYWNEDISLDKYNTDDKEALNCILSNENKDAVLSFLENLCIYPKVKNGYYYPYSNQAASIREIFEREIARNNIEFRSEFKVKSIRKENGTFIVSSLSNEVVKGDKIIIATGGKSYSKTGSDGSGYDLALSLGHNINNLVPSLTPLIGNEKFLKEWENIRCDAKVSLYINNKLEREEIGEIQLTKNGVSGICVFNISGLASRGITNRENVKVKINFLPYIESDFYTWFSKRNDEIQNRTIEEQLESIFNYKLMFVILKLANVSKDSKWNELNEKDKRKLAESIENFELIVTDTEGYDKAQVTSGGVPLIEVDPLTMESKVLPNLFFAGEILDVDGKCGGFNLAFAWISGYLAGRGVNNA